jgi:hypothetical protein
MKSYCLVVEFLQYRKKLKILLIKSNATPSLLMWPFPVFSKRVKTEREKRMGEISGRSRREERSDTILGKYVKRLL